MPDEQAEATTGSSDHSLTSNVENQVKNILTDAQIATAL
jgi:hypothetical protein